MNPSTMINYQEAKDLILADTVKGGLEAIRLEDAIGRVLGQNVYADRDYPPFNRSAMDGFAIRMDDWNRGTRVFPIQETIYAGSRPSNQLAENAAFKIMTGAAVPYPADTVIRKEDAVQNEGFVSFNLSSVDKFQNIALKGQDLTIDELAIEAGTICTPSAIGTLASLGIYQVQVSLLPSVALFTTGNEVKSPGQALNDIEIRNSNYYMLSSLLSQWQIKPSMYKHLPDNKKDLESSIQLALQYDAIILSGGVSAGDADFVPEVLEALGVAKVFHKVAIKPGKPIWYGKKPGGPSVFALPGNPFSSYVTFKLFFETYIRKTVGLEPSTLLYSTYNGHRMKKTNLDEFFPAKFCSGRAGLEPVSSNGSGDIRLGISADVLALHPAHREVISEGDTLAYMML